MAQPDFKTDYDREYLLSKKSAQQKHQNSFKKRAREIMNARKLFNH
jgi:hypothetical protein